MPSAARTRKPTRAGSHLGAAARRSSARGADRMSRAYDTPTASVFRIRYALAFLVGFAVLFGASVGSAQSRPWLWQCEQIGRADAQWTCYVRLLLEDVDRSGDSSDELPRIDARARAADTSLTGNCHALMHEVGRRFAVQHHVTLENLQHYLPRSNDPTCS